MTRSPRPGLLLLLLFVLTAGSITPAFADTVTNYNLTINWMDGSTTSGNFTLHISPGPPQAASLDSWSFETPEPFLTFDPTNSWWQFLHMSCGASDPCFTLYFFNNLSPLKPGLFLTFAGSEFDYAGGPILTSSLDTKSELICDDPCQYFIAGGGPTTTTEPATMLFLATGMVGLVGRRRLWRKA